MSSTEKYFKVAEKDYRLPELQKILDEDNENLVTSSILYFWTAILTNSPYVDFTPNIALEIPALQKLASLKRIPYAGKDGNTGQTLLKTALAELFKARNLRIEGWYSTNILGNQDGYILNIPEHFETKLKDKLHVLEPILNYGDFTHIVDIRYYPPRGDNKEAWDNVDFIGWLNEKMSLKINWQGKDSILAAPLIIDLIRLIELASRLKKFGPQKQLSLYFKHPIGTNTYGFFQQHRNFVNYYETLRRKFKKDNL